MESNQGALKQMPVRAALAVLIGIIVAYLTPTARAVTSHGPDIAAALIFAVIILLFAQQTIRRRKLLREAVYLELNKLRRLYHISKNMSAISTRFRSWFMEIHGNLHMYLAAFEGASLYDYRQNNPGFRRLSYHIYTAPNLESEIEKELYHDLLKTTGIIAQTRQQIKELVAAKMSRADWGWLLSAATVAVLANMALAEPSAAGRLSLGLLIGLILTCLDFVRNADWMKEEMYDWADRYVRNIAKLEYRRHR